MLPARRLTRFVGLSRSTVQAVRVCRSPTRAVRPSASAVALVLSRRHQSDTTTVSGTEKRKPTATPTASAASSSGTARKSKRTKKSKKSATAAAAFSAGTPTSRAEDLDALLATAPTTLQSWGGSGGAGSDRPATVADKALGAASPASPHNAELLAHQRNAQVLNHGDTVVSGADYTALEQIERRRSKVTVAEAEFTVGVTERLFPEVQRLPALHEVHFGDAVVREVDSHAFFAHLKNADDKAVTHDDAAGSVASAQATVADVADISDDAFAAFDAGMGEDSAAPQTTAPSSENPTRTPSRTDQQHSGSADGGRNELDESHLDDGVEAAEQRLLPHAHSDAPWFVPQKGVVRISAMPPAEALRLLALVVYLRHPEEVMAAAASASASAGAAAATQSTAAASSSVLDSAWRVCWSSEACDTLLPLPALREKVRLTCAALGANRDQADASSTASSASLLQLADVISYLDTAPVPVLGFTELLHPREDVRTPAFVFTLYVENVSVQNALGHLAALFGIPQRAFCTHTAASKMSCASLLCAVEQNRLTHELLLLVNTMRHPGFALRISDIREADPSSFGERGVQDLFGALARWQPLYEVEMLVRRVSARDTAALSHRLRALQSVGAVFFCGNREASLARAATDVLHGFYRSAVLNALQRRKAPLAMKQFLASPNVVTAGRARRASTDTTVRHVLRTFVQTDGDWKETVARAPYVWRRRWINALRCTVWNTMASRRLRLGGRQVLVGDLVVRPEYRRDVHQRQVTTLKAEHVKLVETAEEAATLTLEDLFLPFLRGTYPAHLIAPESTAHPVLTSANLFRLVQDLHAGPLLTGLSENSRVLLDIRADVSPLLFRRLLLRPLALQFTVLEDKAPFKSIHYDAARVLESDRWTASQPLAQPAADVSEATPSHDDGAGAGAGGVSPSSSSPPSSSSSHGVFLSGAETALMPQSTVLAKTSLGSRLAPGLLTETFFDIPRPDEYVALGHARRYLDGAVFTNTPHTPSSELDDRLYTVHLRAVVHNGSVGLTQLLREYFILGGVEDEIDSALQHKIHRLRRELDPQTPLLTAPSYCTGCYNRDHDALDACAEFLFKQNRSGAWLRQRERVVQSSVSMRALGTATETETETETETTALPATETAAAAAAPLPAPSSSPASSSLVAHTDTSDTAPSLCMTWQLRRRNAEEKWGVHLTKSLRLIGIEHVRLLEKGTIDFCHLPSAGVAASTDATWGVEDSARAPWPASVVAAVAQQQTAAALSTATAEATPAEARAEAVRALLAQAVAASALSLEALAARPVTLPLALHGTGSPTSLASLMSLAANATPKKAASTHEDEEGSEAPSGLLRRGQWQLSAVEEVRVRDRRDVAAVFLQHQTDRTITLTFVNTAPATDADATGKTTTTTSRTKAVEATTAALPLAPSARGVDTAEAGVSSPMTPFLHVLSDPSVQLALRQTSYASRRWLAQLPETLRLVLTKHRRHYHKNTSWGLQMDARDMGLLNFSALMVQYMFASDSQQRLQLVERAYVSSMSPASEAFPRNDEAMAAQLFGDVLPALEPLLNGVYMVTTVNGKRVRNKAEAAAAMAAFQRAVQQSRVLDAKREVDGHVHLPITLVRKPETLSWLSRIASVEDGGAALVLPPPTAGAPGVTTTTTTTGLSAEAASTVTSLAHDLDGFELAQPEEVEPSSSMDLHGDNNNNKNNKSNSASVVTGAAKTARASTASSAEASAQWAVHRDDSVLCVAPQALDRAATTLSRAVARVAPAPWLSSRQLKAARLTIAVNRRQVTAETQGKWGVRVQRGTLRLLRLQKNQLFGFQVYSAKRAQAVRVADTLRDTTATAGRHAEEEAGNEHGDDGELQARARASRSYADFLYLVEAVNHLPVHSHEGLRRALQHAAAPTNAGPSGAWGTSGTNSSGAGAGTAENQAGTLPESVTLQIRQFPLARVPVTICRPRGSRGRRRDDDADAEESSASSVGLRINKDMCIVGIDAGGLCAAGLREAVVPHCSLMQLVDNNNNNNNKDSTSTVLHTGLLSALAKVQARLPGAAARGAPVTAHTSDAARSAWRYELDEDAVAATDADKSEAQTTTTTTAMTTTTTATTAESSDSMESLVTTIAALARQVEALMESYRQCSGVDATALLQACLVSEFCEQCKSHLPSSPPTPERLAALEADVLPLWQALEAQLSEVRASAYVQWRVVFAAKSKQTLRTPADLMAAVGPHVKEEVLVIQQCLVLE